jgi:hypothetical protein
MRQILLCAVLIELFVIVRAGAQPEVQSQLMRGRSPAIGQRTRTRLHPPVTQRHAPKWDISECEPDDRKCEVEQKLKGTVFDVPFGFNNKGIKGIGF